MRYLVFPFFPFPVCSMGDFQRRFLSCACSLHFHLLKVICAFGRLGAMFGCDKYGIKPDLVSIAKVKHDMKPDLVSIAPENYTHLSSFPGFLFWIYAHWSRSREP